MPPTPEEAEAWLTDSSPDAYKKLVDRLLASPHYGERWARHWMDVVHFAETHGHDQDRPRDNAWPYRDYLIRAFNDDKPYARFVQEQIAGDVLFPDDPWATIATGFLAAGPWDESSLRDIREDTIDREIGRYLDRDDMVTRLSARSSARRCTAPAATITSSIRFRRRSTTACRPCSRVSTRQTDRMTRTRMWGAGVALCRSKCRSRADKTAFNLPNVMVLLHAKRELAALPPPRLVYCGTPKSRRTAPLPRPEPRPVHVFKRGDIRDPALAKPGTLACVPGLPSRFEADSEGQRRAALARLADRPAQRADLAVDRQSRLAISFRPGHGRHAQRLRPHGRRRRRTPSCSTGWRATFRDDGGSLKQLHRLIVTSAAYRQVVASIDPTTPRSTPTTACSGA